MNYAELANQINRPYSTVRKWRNEITTISGYEFERIKVSNGPKRKNRTTYDFNDEEVKQFSKLSELLQSGASKVDAITQFFGNLELEAKEKQEDELQNLKQVTLSQSKSIENLLQQEKLLQRQLTMLNQNVSDLVERIESLENKGFINKFKTKK